jgi:4a-hydroxytetrahydrobiopterin dehydratase
MDHAPCEDTSTIRKELTQIKVWVKLKTHSAGGITDKDFARARKIEEVVLWRPEPGGPLEGTPNAFVKRK